MRMLSQNIHIIRRRQLRLTCPQCHQTLPQSRVPPPRRELPVFTVSHFRFRQQGHIHAQKFTLCFQEVRIISRRCKHRTSRFGIPHRKQRQVTRHLSGGSRRHIVRLTACQRHIMLRIEYINRSFRHVKDGFNTLFCKYIQEIIRNLHNKEKLIN